MHIATDRIKPQALFIETTNYYSIYGTKKRGQKETEESKKDRRQSGKTEKRERLEKEKEKKGRVRKDQRKKRSTRNYRLIGKALRAAD